MKQKNVNVLLSLILFGLAAALWISQRPLAGANDRMENFVAQGPGYISQEIPLSDFEASMLGEARALKRVYYWKGQPYAFTMLDGTRNRHAAHDPRYCFRGAGWTIAQDKAIPFAGGSARHISLQREGEQSEALFFYSTGKKSFDAPLEYWIKATWRRWLRSHGGPEPLLVMIQPLSSGARLDVALSEFLPLLPLP